MSSITKSFRRAVAAAVTALAITAVQALPLTTIPDFSGTAIVAGAASYAPAKVTGVKASGVGNTAATLTWSKVSNAKGYRIYVYNASKQKYTKVTTIAKNTAEYKLKGLSAGSSYKYKVRAYRKVNGSTYWGKCSDALTLTTKSYAPAKVTGVTAKADSSSSGTLRWEKVSSASGYRVYVFNASTKKYTKVTTLSGNSKTSYKVTGLKANTSYKYKIRAYRKVNGVTYWGTSSNVVTLKTKGTKSSWVDELSSLERAYYNFGTKKSFSDSDWALIHNDLCKRAMSFDGKQDVYISPGGCIVYDDCQWKIKKVHFPGVLHITIDTSLFCAHEVNERGVPADYQGGFLPGAHAGPDTINSYTDLLWWMEECRAQVDHTIRRATGYGYYDPDEDDYAWYKKYGYDVTVNPDWYYLGGYNIDANVLLVLY